MKTGFSLLAFTGALMLQTGFTHAQDRKIEQAIKHRKAAFTLMATYVNRMVQTVDGHRPFDAKLMAQDAKTVELLSKLPWEGFVEGSERGDTSAKEDIWFEEEKFKRYAYDLQTKTAAVTVAAESGGFDRFTCSLASIFIIHPQTPSLS